MCIVGYSDNFQCGVFDLTGFWTLIIIRLTREPEGERASPDRRYVKLRNSRLLFQSQDGYFLFFMFRITTISMNLLPVLKID